MAMDGIGTGHVQGSSDTEVVAPFNVKESFFAGRKIAINSKSLLTVCTSDSHPFDDQVDVLYEVVSQSRLSPDPNNKHLQKLFNSWFFGEICQLPGRNYQCLCREIHKKYPGQRVGGVLFENQLRFAQSAEQDVSALLSLAACNLIEADRLIVLHNRQKSEKNASSLLLARAGEKRKESHERLSKAYELDPILTQKQIRSWLIQFALNKGLSFQIDDIEKIKHFRAEFQDKLSLRWFKMLVDSGFYPETRILAHPLLLAEQLSSIAQELNRVNFFYPRTAYDSAVLLFSVYDALPKFIQYGNYFLPKLKEDDDTLFAALRSAIFDDAARVSHQSALYLHQLQAPGPSHRLSSTVGKTKATTDRAEIWSVSGGKTNLQLEGLFMTQKKPGRGETAVTWHQRGNEFPEPDDVGTAMANVINVMTYPKPDDKTRIYNMPTHRDRMIRAYNQLGQSLHKDEQRVEVLPDVLYGYTCFLMGWLHEQKLIDHASPVEAAAFYQKAVARGQFLPLGLKAGDLYAEIGDYHLAHECYELVQKHLQTIIDNIQAREGNGPISEQSGYLSPSFMDYLASKIEYLSIKVKDTVYLHNLTPVEIQQYVNGVAAEEKTNSSISVKLETNPDEADAAITEFGANWVGPGTKVPTTPKNKKRNRTVLCNLVRNRLTSQWDPAVCRALKHYCQRRKQAKFSPAEQIDWLDSALKKLKRKRGTELLVEHLAWEHIHVAEQTQFDRHGAAAKMAREHLNIARDLLLENIIYKTGIHYSELPQPDHFEADVLGMVTAVTCDLAPMEVAEWLFGIVCQTRSLGHVFSTFKLLYPGSKTIDSLNKGWFSLKRLYQTP